MRVTAPVTARGARFHCGFDGKNATSWWSTVCIELLEYRKGNVFMMASALRCSVIHAVARVCVCPCRSCPRWSCSLPTAPDLRSRAWKTDSVREVVADGQIYGNNLPAKTSGLDLRQRARRAHARAGAIPEGERRQGSVSSMAAALQDRRDRQLHRPGGHACCSSASMGPMPKCSRNRSRQAPSWVIGWPTVAAATWHQQVQTSVGIVAAQEILSAHICDEVFLSERPMANGTTAWYRRSTMGLQKIVGPIDWDVDGGDWDCWRNKATPAACAMESRHPEWPARRERRAPNARSADSTSALTARWR